MNRGVYLESQEYICRMRKKNAKFQESGQILDCGMSLKFDEHGKVLAVFGVKHFRAF